MVRGEKGFKVIISIPKMEENCHNTSLEAERKCKKNFKKMRGNYQVLENRGKDLSYTQVSQAD